MDGCGKAVTDSDNREARPLAGVPVAGRADVQNCDELAQALDVPADDTTGHSLAVDAFNLEFFDSSGIRCLLSAARRVRSQGGKFVVLDTGRLARRIRWMNLAEQLPVMAALPA